MTRGCRVLPCHDHTNHLGPCNSLENRNARVPVHLWRVAVFVGQDRLAVNQDVKLPTVRPCLDNQIHCAQLLRRLTILSRRHAADVEIHVRHRLITEVQRPCSSPWAWDSAPAVARRGARGRRDIAKEAEVGVLFQRASPWTSLLARDAWQGRPWKLTGAWPGLDTQLGSGQSTQLRTQKHSYGFTISGAVSRCRQPPCLRREWDRQGQHLRRLTHVCQGVE